MNMETRQRARILVADLLKSRGDDGQLADSESLLLSGRLQSLDAVTIAVFLEREYAIDFSVVGFEDLAAATLNYSALNAAPKPP